MLAQMYSGTPVIRTPVDQQEWTGISEVSLFQGFLLYVRIVQKVRVSLEREVYRERKREKERGRKKEGERREGERKREKERGRKDSSLRLLCRGVRLPPAVRLSQ